MATVDLVMPKMGESIMEATILKWHKKPGDAVKMEETVLEIATDKVDSEVPSTEEGIMEEVLYKENDVVPVGAVIARIKTGTPETVKELQPEAPPLQKTGTAEEEPKSREVKKQEEPAPVTNFIPTPTATLNTNRFYSPLVLNIAAQEDISMMELEHIPGTGNEGRVTKKDILQYVSYKRSGKVHGVKEKDILYKEKDTGSKEQAPQPMVIPLSKVEPSAATGTQSGNVEIIEMDRMRKLIAEHMVRSKQISPHVTSFSEADVTNLVKWRDKMKKEFEKREGTKITFTPLFIEAIVKCIKRFPLVNSSVDGERIIVKKDINIGMATALPNGNLIVPIIKNAGQLNLVGLSRQVNTLADNARNNRLKPEDTQDGTFTMTNVGTFGSLMGTPIINQPQVAILAVGAIKKRPVVIETAHGDSIAIRHMMYLSMSYDHRIVDGSIGASFLTAVANELENFDLNREI
jgi:2-oxoglutarate dehydrogenase E2 component (dihydrolipoamide succinyltransferase)